ncbi:MAG TPA: GNAT family N-acetyltransferase [Clostridia bacterium]|nr:GNAT family N-acetyltransferase [Clostridia bacterium]
MFIIDYVTEKDRDFWFKLDSYISENEFLLKIRDKRGYIIKDDDKPIGVMRYNLFWDLIPFLNLIYFEEEYRCKGYGTIAMRYWEDEMRQQGFKIAMTSTMVEETSQHFYRKLGYKDCGCLIKEIPPFVETMEMFMNKAL